MRSVLRNLLPLKLVLFIGLSSCSSGAPTATADSASVSAPKPSSAPTPCASEPPSAAPTESPAPSAPASSSVPQGIEPPPPGGKEPAGQVDAMFGDEGSVVIGAAGFTGSEVNALIAVKDGVVLGGAASSYVSEGYRGRVAAAWRVNAQGELVTDFGENGSWLSAAERSDEVVYAVALGPDGALYLAGEGTLGFASEIFPRLWRLSEQGEQDVSYGSASTGYADTILDTVHYDSRGGPEDQIGPWFGNAHALAFDAQGRLLLGASLNGFASFDTPAVYRMTAGGQLDTSFSDDGVAINISGFPAVNVGALFLGGDGAMYLVGDNQTATVWKFAVDGSPIPAYGGNDTLSPPIYGTSFIGLDEIGRRGVAWRDGVLDSTARVTVTGLSFAADYPGEPTRGYRMTAARMGTDGLLDRSYGTEGIFVEPEYSTGYAVTTGPTGVIYVCGVREETVGGQARDAATVWALTPDGAPLASFGDGGLLVLPQLPDATGPALCRDLVVTHDGYLYVAGNTLAATDEDPERPQAFVFRVK